MDGRVKPVVAGLVFVLSVSAVSGAVTLSQMRGNDAPGKGDGPSGRKEVTSKVKPKSDRPPEIRLVSASTDETPKASADAGESEMSLGEALGFGTARGRQGGNRPGHGIGKGHHHHGHGHGHGHGHHDHDNHPPVSPADPHDHHHHHHGHGHGHGHGHDHDGHGPRGRDRR